MAKGRISTVVVAVMMLTLTAGSAVQGGPVPGPGGEGDAPSIPPAPASVPTGFFENQGQFPDGDVRFYRGLPSGGVAFTSDRVVMSVRDPSAGGAVRALLDMDRRGHGPELEDLLSREVAGHTVSLSFPGSREVRPVGVGPLPGSHSFLLGNDPSGWRTGVSMFSRVVYEDLWEGVDLVYTLGERGLKYEFVVAPGVEASTVRVRVSGHQGLSIVDGDLVTATSVGNIVDGGLSVFHRDAPLEDLPSSFALLDGDTYAFQVTGRDTGRTLVIDPWVLSTYLGGAGDDGVMRVEVDADGDIYGSGVTDSGNFPTSNGAFQTSLSGWLNIFVTKLTSDGASLVFSTYIGGSFYEIANDMHVDASEDVYLCGDTYSTDYPTTAGAYQNTSFGSGMNLTVDSFVTKLDASGSRLDYSTYLATDGEDSLLGMDVDTSGRVHVTGYTTSFNMTCSAGAFQDTKADGEWYYEAVVRVLDATGGRQLHATYLGGNDDDEGYDLQLNATGVVFVTGLTYSDDFPVTGRAYQRSLKGAVTSGFVTKLKPDLTDLHYSTYLGGSEDQELYALALDPNDNATVTGYTYSTDYPVTADAYDRSIGFDDMDVVVSQLSADGSSLVHSTFLGKSGEDEVTDIGIGPTGEYHVVGTTDSASFPTTTGAVQTKLKGESDGFYGVLSQNMSQLIWGTYIGGSAEDYMSCVRPVGEVGTFVSGFTYSTDLHTTAGAFQTRHGGGEVEGFLGKLTFDSLPPLAEAGPDVSIDQHETVHFNGSNCSDNIEVVNWTWSFYYDDGRIELFGPLASFTFHEAGEYEVTLVVSDAANLEGTDSLAVTVRDITPPTAEAGRTRTVDQHATVVLDGLGSADNVGVANWTWTFEYGGGEVVLHGPDPEFTFDDAGTYNVTLTVTDAAGLTAEDWVTIYVIDVTDPRVDAGTDVRVDQHETVTLDASACSDNVGIANWTWTFVYRGNPMSLYGEEVTFVFDDAGSYDVTLTVSDDAGNLAVDVVNVHVTDTTPPTANAGEDVEVMQGTTVDLDGTGSYDNTRIASYTWTFVYQGVSIELSGSVPDYFFEAAGAYEITLNVTDLEGNHGVDTVTVVVRDITRPMAEAGDDITIDQGDTATFDGLSSTDNVEVASWTWTFTCDGEEVELTGPTPGFAFDDAGSYRVDLVVTDAAGNRAEDHLTVIVRDVTGPVADAGGDREVDQGRAVTLDGSGSTDNVGIDTYTWTFDDGGGTETLTGRVSQFAFQEPGDYTVTLTVADAAGNSGTDSFSLHVRDTVNPTPPAMSSIEAGGRERVPFAASGAIDNVGAVNWTWTFEEGGRTVTLEGERVTHTFEEAGDYQVTLTVADAEGNTATATLDVTVTSSAWLWIALVAVLVVIAVAAFMVTRRRGAPAPAPDEEAPPEDGEEGVEITVEERYAE